MLAQGLSLLARLMGWVVVAGALSTWALASGLQPEIGGQWQQGGHLYGWVPPGSEVLVNGKPAAINDLGQLFFGFSRDEKLQQLIQIRSSEGTWQQKIRLTKRNYRVQKVTGVPGRTVNPDESHLERIRREMKMVGEARRTGFTSEGVLQPFVWPVFGRISGVYGSQRFYNGQPRNPHFGVDVARPKGTPVYAPAEGLVTLAEGDLFFSGGTVIIDHGLGLTSTLMHLSEVRVRAGQSIKQGEVIGAVGATGRATGPHLDWRMNWRSARIDPTLLVPPMKDLCADLKVTSESTEPVWLFVHQTGQMIGPGTEFVEWLQGQGRTLCHLPVPDHRLDQLASYLLNGVEKIRQRRGDRQVPVHVIAHGNAGFVARQMLAEGDLWVERLIAIDPPLASELDETELSHSRSLGPNKWRSHRRGADKADQPNVTVLRSTGFKPPEMPWQFALASLGRLVMTQVPDPHTQHWVLPRGHEPFWHSSHFQNWLQNNL